MKLKAVYATQEEIPSEYANLYTERNGKWELTGVEGIRTQADVDRVQGALTKERNDHKALREKYGVLGDRDPAEILTQLDRIPELEIAAEGRLDNGRIETLVEQRIRAKLAPVERERDQLRTQLTESETAATALREERRQTNINSAIRDACVKAKVLPDAIEDAIMLAERNFTQDDAGNIVTRDNVNGLTPGLDATTWLSDMQARRPHWWPASQGGGASGGNGGSTVVNPWKAETRNLTEQGRIMRENPTLAENMRKAAGVN